MSRVKYLERARLEAKKTEFSSLPDIIRRFLVGHFLPDPFERVVPTSGQGCKADFIFIHVPKTAGSSISSFFSVEPLHIPLSRYFAADYARAKNTYKVAFVRDPIERLHSAFNYLNSHIGINNSLDVRWSEDNLSKYDSFSDFLDHLEDPKLARSLMSWTHFRPQTDWIVERPGGEIHVDFLGRFENLQQDIKALGDMFGVEISLPHLRTPKRPREATSIERRHRETIWKLYSSDYERLGCKIE